MEYKKEVKLWRKELGEASKRHIKLQKKMDVLQHFEQSPSKADINLQTQVDDLEQIHDSSSNSTTFCTICAGSIENFVPEYFCGDPINAICIKCTREANLLITSEVPDPFSSFPDDMPSSLCSHWNPPYSVTAPCIAFQPSFRAHYALLPNPGSSLTSKEEFMQEFKLVMEEHQRRMEERCNQM